VGSNPGRTSTQGLLKKRIGVMMLAVILDLVSVQIALLGGDVEPLALSPSSFLH